MKKALVVFLILAVAGGLFAQLSFSGNVQTGLGIGITDQDGVDPKIDYIRDRGASGMQGLFNVNYTGKSDDFGSWGANVSFRGRQTGKFGADSWSVAVPTRNLWWQPNSFVRLDLGTNDPGGFGSRGGLDVSNGVRDDAAGLKLLLTPIAGLSIGAHAGYGNSDLLLENISLRFGVKYEVPSLLTVVANARLYPEVKDYTKLQFAAGVDYQGLSALGLTKLAVDAAAFDFGNEAKSFMGAGLQVGYALGALSANARARVYFATGNDLNKDFMPMLFRGELYYAINSIAKAGFEAQYAKGRTPEFNFRHAYEAGGLASADDFARDKNSYIAISPRVTFSVGPEIVLGYNLQLNTSDGAAASATAPKTQHLIYGIVNVSF